MSPRRLIAVHILAIAGVTGQETYPARPNSPTVPSHGRLIPVELDPRETIISLDQLVGSADAIVDGTVASTFPAEAIDLRPATPLIETRAVISISKVLFGRNIAPGTEKIILTQVGGQYGQWNIVPFEAPLVQAGERYIFFLNLDSRSLPQTVPGTPRFAATGIWSGLAKVVDSQIQFPGRASPGLRANNQSDVPAFVASLQERISRIKTNAIEVMPYVRLGPGFDPKNPNTR